MAAVSNHRPDALEKISRVRYIVAASDHPLMEQSKPSVCPLCNVAVKPTEPVGPPTMERFVVHLRCWLRKRHGVQPPPTRPDAAT